MSTRSLTVFQDEFGKEIVVMYRHFDGYLDGHGRELVEFLYGIRVVNGIPLDSTERLANGAENLAAMVVAHFASDSEAGNFYLYPAGTRDIGEEYTYVVFPDGLNRVGVEAYGYQGDKLDLTELKKTTRLLAGFATDEELLRGQKADQE